MLYFSCEETRNLMSDILYLIFTLIFFAVCFGFVALCQRLREG